MTTTTTTTTRTTLAVLFLLLSLGGLAACPEGGEGVIGDDDDATAGDDDDDASGGDDDDDVTPTTAQQVTLTTDDGLTIVGTYQAGYGADPGPAVLLLHQITHDRQDFNSVWFNFVEQGISALAIDFRSHGGSDVATVGLEDLLTDPDQLKWDVLAGLDYLQGRAEVDPDRIGVFGLSVGGNLAVVANHNRASWGVKSICAVSANRDRVLDLAETDTLDLENAQYVAAENEEPQATMATQLFEETEEPKDLRLILGTDDHGADLLAGSGDAQVGIPAWFVEQL